MRLAAVIVAFAACLAGCSAALDWYGISRIDACNLEVPSTRSIRGDFVRRLRVRVESDDVSTSFEVVLQKRDDRLALVGFNPFGARIFAVEQEGEEVRIDARLGPAQPVPPLHVLHDLYYWPLQVSRSDSVAVTVAEDGKSASIANPRCGYRSTIYLLPDDSELD
jgi:hypothetical protein